MHACRCGRSFKTAQGLGLHYRKCPLRGKAPEQMTTQELVSTAWHLLEQNQEVVNQLVVQVSTLARQLGCHLEPVKKQK